MNAIKVTPRIAVCIGIAKAKGYAVLWEDDWLTIITPLRSYARRFPNDTTKTEEWLWAGLFDLGDIPMFIEPEYAWTLLEQVLDNQGNHKLVYMYRLTELALETASLKIAEDWLDLYNKGLIDETN